MRRFRLISRDDAYDPLIYGEVYSGYVKPHGWEEDVLWNTKFNPEDWQEVLEETQVHQTDLGHYAGEFLKSIFSNPECSKDSRSEPMSAELIVKWAIDISKELIKQLKEECQDK